MAKIVKNTDKRTAEQAYDEHKKSIMERLAEIDAAMKNDLLGFGRKTAEKLHWGHVGTVAEIDEQLTRLTDMLYKRGEHDPRNN